jgi:hypothetical protein
MKHLKGIILLLIPIIVNSQNEITPTTEVRITGQVKSTVAFSLQKADQYTVYKLDSLVIYNHLMERKKAVHDIKGIRVKDILEKAGFSEQNPKFLSEYYFTCVASDGYKVVYSWNELFNTEAGNQVYIVVEAEGKKADLMGERILMLSASDQATGRRFVKNLAEIKVERVK